MHLKSLPYWLCALCLTLGLASCGGSDKKDSGGKDGGETASATASGSETPGPDETEGPKESPTPTTSESDASCGPNAVGGGLPGSVEPAKVKKALKVPLDDLRLGDGTATLKVDGIVELKKIAKADGGKYELGKKSRFIGIAYRLQVDAKDRVANGRVAAAFRMVAGDQTFPQSDGLEGCSSISSTLSQAKTLPKSLRDKLDSAGASVGTGETVRSIAVFAVPKTSKLQAWYSPRLQLAVDLSSARKL